MLGPLVDLDPLCDRLQGGDEMSAVGELPSGQPTGNGRGPQPYRGPARRVRKIDFAQLDGLSTRRPGAARDRGRLVSFIEPQEKRDRLYVKSQEELKEKFQFGRMGGVA